MLMFDVGIWQMSLNKATYIQGTHFISFCFPWKSNPWPWRCWHHAPLFKIQESFWQNPETKEIKQIIDDKFSGVISMFYLLL